MNDVSPGQPPRVAHREFNHPGPPAVDSGPRNRRDSAPIPAPERYSSSSCFASGPSVASSPSAVTVISKVE